MNKKLNTYASYLLRNRKDLIITIDTNILLLYFIGKYDTGFIEKFDRTAIYTEEEFFLLSEIIKNAREITITPNIITEINNLSKRLNDNIYFDIFRDILNKINEKYFKSKILCKNDCFYNFDIADISVLELAKIGYLVVTDDRKLVGLLRSLKYDVIYWSEIKNLLWKDILK